MSEPKLINEPSDVIDHILSEQKKFIITQFTAGPDGMETIECRTSFATISCRLIDDEELEYTESGPKLTDYVTYLLKKNRKRKVTSLHKERIGVERSGALTERFGVCRGTRIILKYRLRPATVTIEYTVPRSTKITHRLTDESNFEARNGLSVR